MTKRKITAHKGSRTKWLPGGRVTEAEHKSLVKAMRETGLGFADFVLLLLKHWRERQ